MSQTTSNTPLPTPHDLLLPADSAGDALPIWLLRDGRLDEELAGQLSAGQRQWLRAIGFTGAARRHALLPGEGGRLTGAVLGLGDLSADAVEAAELVGLLPTVLPAGTYYLASPARRAELAAIAWGLGAYRFRRYKSADAEATPALRLPKGVDRDWVLAAVEAVWHGRDLINTPANDMGPAELQAAAESIAARHGASATTIVGDDLLKQNFPLIHAVGRASPRAPRLIDITWGRADAPKVTLVGKGICFDTGGLDLKPASGMLLMKKDMGGAAAVLSLAQMIMARKLDVRLRVLIPAAENSVSGASFRPGDVVRSRSGKTVEIGNTDAEGRLVLADALTLADDDAPDYLMTFATLTGAARVALGPDVQPFYCNDDELAATIAAAGKEVCEQVWRMPMAASYDGWLESGVADMNNVSDNAFAGSVVAAVFLKRFVRRARHFAHFDIYGWRPTPKPLGPKGGEPNAARAVFEALRRIAPAGTQVQD
jgi:leucyl aminopeptidase